MNGTTSSAQQATDSNPALLSGMRVVELGQLVAAPACTRILALLGAEVWKIEPPFVGEPSRRVGPFRDGRPDPETSALYLYLNTAKKGLTLNIGSRAGRRLFLQLIKNADLLVENLGVGKLAEHGLDFQLLRSIAPQLVITSITPFGANGPDAHRPADELAILALAGIAAEFGKAGRVPLRPCGYQASHAAAYAAVGASLAALFARRRTGRGQLVDVSMLEAAATCVQSDFTNFVHTRRPTVRGGRDGTTLRIPCRDGTVEVSIFFGTQWSRLADLVGRPELRSDPRFLTSEARKQHLAEAAEEVGRWSDTLSKVEVYRRGQQAGLAMGFVASVDEAIRFEQEWVRGFYTRVAHPAAGEAVFPGLPTLVNGRAVQVGRAPLLGEHNVEVYRDRLGLSSEKLIHLRQSNVI